MDLHLPTRLRLGVSGCLLGDVVRYDGGHKRDAWIADRFGPMVEWTRVCPEAEAGLGVPREAIRLERDARGGIAVRGVSSGTDHTDTLDDFARRRLEGLELEALDGWVFKARSPSCGVEGVVVHDHGAGSDARAPGVFAAALLERDRYLPTCNEDDVQSPAARRHFFERAQTRARWRGLCRALDDAPATRDAALARFLGRHELLLTCRGSELPTPGAATTDVAALGALGRELAARMAHAPTIEGHVRALAHLHDRLTTVSTDERVALAILIADVARGELDVEVPRQLVRGIVLRAGLTALAAQHYLDPVP